MNKDVLRTDEQQKHDYLRAVNIIIKDYIKINREYRFDGLFWHSLIVGKFNQQVLDQYGSEVDKRYNTMIMRSYDWENYVYKVNILADYLYSTNRTTPDAIENGIRLFLDNQDLTNYILKSSVMRNGHFYFNFLEAVDELELSDAMRSKIKYMNKPDDRVGRIILRDLMFEYPMNLITIASKEALKEEILLKYDALTNSNY